MAKKKLVIYSERDKNIFDDFFIIIAGGLGALGIADLLSSNWWGLIKLGIAFLIIVFVSTWIRKKSDKKK